MTVEQIRVIDIISFDKKTGEVWLTISDHLDWSNTLEHLKLLQVKLNAYLAFVESGEIFERYRRAKNRPVVFEVVFQLSPDEQGREFLVRAQEFIKTAGFELRHRVFAQSEEN